MYEVRKVKLSVVIPAYNEAENFKRGVLDQVYTYLRKQRYNWEIVLVNDGSTDQTWKCLRRFAHRSPRIKIIDVAHSGKVGAVSAGVMASKGEIILFTDFDQSTPITQVSKVLKEFSRGAHLVIGNRKSPERSLLGLLRSKTFSLLVQLIVLPGISDTQCGFKAFQNNIAKELFSALEVTRHTQKGGYMGAFDVELLFLARQRGYQIKPIPVCWREIKSDKLSFSEPFKMLRDVIRVRLYYH